MAEIIKINTFGNQEQEWEMEQKEVAPSGKVLVTLTNVKTREIKEGFIKSLYSSGKYEIEIISGKKWAY